MTVSLERPVKAPVPVYPSRVVVNDRETADDSRRAVLTVRMAVDRDMLAVALDLAMGGPDATDPDTWSVETIREAVECQLGMDGTYQIWRDRRLLGEMVDDPTVGEFVRAEFRAIDRAFPEHAPAAA